MPEPYHALTENEKLDTTHCNKHLLMNEPQNNTYASKETHGARAIIALRCDDDGTARSSFVQFEL